MKKLVFPDEVLTTPKRPDMGIDENRQAVVTAVCGIIEKAGSILQGYGYRVNVVIDPMGARQ